MATTGAPLNLPLMADSDRTPYSVYNAAMAILNGGAGASAWTSWVPTWNSLTLGNGVVVAKYMQIGKLVVCRLSLVFGTTTAVTGSGVQFSLPVTRAAYGGGAGRTSIGQARYFDASAPAGYEGRVVNVATTTGWLIAMNAAGTYLQAADIAATIPFTWTTSDEIGVQIYYEAA